MNNVLRRSSALVVSSLLVAGLAACDIFGNDDAATPTATVTAEPPDAEVTHPEAVLPGSVDDLEAEMISACLLGAPGQVAYCECVVQWYIDFVSVEILEMMANELGVMPWLTDGFSPEDIEAISPFVPSDELVEWSFASLEASFECMRLMDLGQFDLGPLGDLIDLDAHDIGDMMLDNLRDMRRMIEDPEAFLRDLMP